MAQINRTKSFIKRNWWIIPLSLTFFVVICFGTARFIHNLADKSDTNAAEEPLIESIPETDNAIEEDTVEAASPIYSLSRIDSIPDGGWQAERSFPDQAGYVDNTLAMNSMYSFTFFSGQGRLYFEVGESIESFNLFVNNHIVNTEGISAGCYVLDISDIALNGTNTIQVSNVVSSNVDEKVIVRIPYPTVIDGTLADVGIDEKPLELIDSIVQSDIDNGFSSAQMAIVKDGRLVYQNAWGKLNSYDKDGNILEEGTPVTNDTMYDLASNTKVYAAVYAMQYLTDKGEITLDTKITEIFGDEFVDDTIEIRFEKFVGDYPGFETIKEWKSQITVKDLLLHQAGFPDSGHYHNDKFDAVSQKLTFDVDNVLYVKDADKEKTLKEGIFRTPLIYKPRTKTMYSDIDYMLLGLIVEKVTGKDLNSFLKEIYWNPMGLERITFCPTENGFNNTDCAATELNGNTRDGLVDFPGVRTDTIQGEVHDEECYYTMEGVSGHAGLFASATDLAKLASVMLTGGYGNNLFFSKNTRDLFIAPQSNMTLNYGIGWWREADDKRVWYFGTQSPEDTVGHQGFTGTLTMIDYDNNMVLVFLTNSINTPIFEPVKIENANQYCGKYYTTSTLGFVPQILYTGIGNTQSPEEALELLIKDMVNEKQKLVDKAATDRGEPLGDEHPMKKALKALEQAAR